MEKSGHFWKNGHFSGWIWPDWGNTAWADMAGLGSIGLRGGGYKTVRGGGEVMVYPYKKRGERFSYLQGGGTRSVGVVLTWVLEVLALLRGSTKNVQKVSDL